MAADPPVENAVSWLCRVILGGAFVVAATFKLLDPAAFAVDIGHYHLLPHPATIALAVYLPWLELLSGAAVLIRRVDRGALLILTVLCGIFCVALASAWIRGLDIECGCFGHAVATPSVVALGRSLALGLLALWLYRRRRDEAVPKPASR